VSQSDLEALLAAVAQKNANPAAGIFGPASMSWKINRESALFLGAGRAALLQLAHPWVAAALAEHSTLLAKPIARFHNTFRIVFTMIFGSLDQATTAARHLYALHTRIQGKMPEAVAAYPRGSHYEANEIGALRWVYATLVESAVMAYECALGPLAAAEREQYYAESRTLAGLFGIPASALPADWNSFLDYNRQMHASNVLGVSAGARAMAQSLLAGSGSWIHPPRWYRALTAAWMPVRFREEFEIEFGFAAQRAALSAMRRLPGIYRMLPQPIRFTGPWHQAQERLQGRPAGPLTRLSNQFWIGQMLLPFSGNSVLHEGHQGTTIAE
jgi:uncharacterized protein (DUF2236 family)